MPVTTNVFVDEINQTSVDKIDLLFMIDNSASMSDKQAILRLAVPDLVARLVNPVCVDSEGNLGAAVAPDEPCPPGEAREFSPVSDIHVGVISSSLGDLTADTACPGPTSQNYVPERRDGGHLIGSLPRGAGTTDGPHGFLSWRAGVTDPERFSADFARMIERVGEQGCGFEASLESWYRFLIDPQPYRELRRASCPGQDPERLDCVEPARDAAGNVLMDEVLLEQRAAFLRPDSLVAIIMLSDENDCSVQARGGSWRVLDTSQPMYRASSACEEDENAKCCYSCGVLPPEGCPADPICEVEDRTNGVFRRRMPPELDHGNLRCFDQQRRFGIDLLYPTARYVNALRQYELCAGAPDLSLDGCPEDQRVRNPLFSGGRDRSLVFLGGIVGVPWQLIASELDARGRALSNPSTELRFKTVQELTDDDIWSRIVGDRGQPWRPARAGVAEEPALPRILPAEPFMQESAAPRAGIDPGNPINGREYDTTQGNAADTAGDLQYSCIFPLPEPRQCTAEGPADQSCDCSLRVLDKPLCESSPGTSPPGTTQHWAKAYPGTRQLEVLRDFGDNSIVASICARNVDVTSQPDFGYRPAIGAIVDRLKEQLGSRCLPRPLDPADDGTVACTLVETRPKPDGTCGCDARLARRQPTDRLEALARTELARDPAQPCGADDPRCERACVCEVLQVQQVQGVDPEAALETCREDVAAAGVEGWCYVANTPEQRIGNPELVAGCPPTQRQLLRFAGGGLAPNTTTFMACLGAELD